MEWVVTTARSVDEAKSQALDQLGVAEDDAEFEILEEPRAGLFGRVRGEAKVRARVRPTQPRPKMDRRDRRKKGDGESRRPARDAAELASSAVTSAVTGAVTGDDAVDGDASTPRRGSASGKGAAAGRTNSSRGTRGRTASASGSDATGGPGDDDAAKASALAAAVAMVADEFGGAAAEEASAGGRHTDESNGATDAGADGSPRRRGRRGGAGRNGARNTADGAGDDRRPAAQPGHDRDAEDEYGHHEETEMDAAEVGEAARTFVEGLVTAFGLDGTTTVCREGDDFEVAVDGADLGLLVGPRGTTLQAVQELTRVASQRRLGDHDTRLRVDVAGYRVRRREALTRFAAQVADEVESTGTARSLEPMSSSDRKVIHDALSERAGVVTRSEGDDPQRRVVIAPAND